MSYNNISAEKILLISVKPEFAEKIMNGEKTIELRKSAPKKVSKDSYILIYVTSPVKELWGICRINNIIKEDPFTFWNNYGDKTGITETQFKDYYKTNQNAFGIELKDIRNFSKYSIELKQLKKAFPNFMPPQTYSYINSDKINFSVLKLILNKIENRASIRS
ncbi:ASCH domain-containing protein [Gramella lutea]|uniref:ASCH domain-containing protein n=1 Tax=Christiangramia lutea TaxID=1607951 RepID=A0A9X1V5X3_9FLAO|nr:ASCH domain-containing protein [Christiangramia lutea]MCH4824435.1 ASCH domain-containing protein [Christiangramia lutea]